MQSFLNKFILGVGICVVAFALSAGYVSANYIPDISGEVRVQGTNAPVARVWVKMTNKDGYSRYARTDSNGRYTFVGWTQCDRCDETQLNVPIDTDLDGVNDAVMYEADPNDLATGSGGSTFSCGRDPFTFSVVKPKGWSGSFTSVGNASAKCSGVDENGYCLNNSQIAPPTPVMYYITGKNLSPTPTTRISGTVTPTQSATLTPTIIPASCSFNNIPATKDIRVGTADYLPVGVTQVGGTVDQVTFTSDNGSVVSVCRSPLCSPGLTTYTDTAPFQTGLTGFTAGQSTRVRITGRMLSEGVTCTPASVLVNVLNLPSWCQFKETDAITNGSISCQIPPTCNATTGCSNSLITQDPGGESPGIAIANSSVSSGAGAVSRPQPPYGWQSKTSYNGIRYTYDFFEKKTQGLKMRELTFPIINSVSDLTSGTTEEGYYWVRYTGGAPLEIANDINIGSQKIVLFVNNADLIIRGSINVTRGKGFFMTIVKGDIKIDPGVGGGGTQADLEGIYLTEKQLKTGTNGSGNDLDLNVRGSVVAFDKVVMERNLSDNSKTPGELFEFGPDQLLMFPSRLGDQNLNWKEVAP